MEHNFTPLLSAERLSSAKSILFVTHCAIGDFAYMQAMFKKFAALHPHIKIDLWIDDVRRKHSWYRPWTWKHLQNYWLYDWVASYPLFNKVYTKTYNLYQFWNSVRIASDEHYDIIVSLCTLRSQRYAKVIRWFIGPHSYIVGIDDYKGRARKYFDGVISLDMPSKKNGAWHISELYSYQCEQLFGASLSFEERFPQITIPQIWRSEADYLFSKWRIESSGKVLFINPYAKCSKRSWPLSNVVELIESMQAAGDKAHYIVNAPPEKSQDAAKALKHLKHVHIFDSTDHFFLLPAIMQRCSLVISVETSTMHLAVGLKSKIVPLMRRKTPEWIPLGLSADDVVFTPGNGRLETISVEQVKTKIASL
jgi:heptosyltransferase-3